MTYRDLFIQVGTLNGVTSRAMEFGFDKIDDQSVRDFLDTEVVWKSGFSEKRIPELAKLIHGIMNTPNGIAALKSLAAQHTKS